MFPLTGIRKCELQSHQSAFSQEAYVKHLVSGSWSTWMDSAYKIRITWLYRPLVGQEMRLERTTFLVKKRKLLLTDFTNLVTSWTEFRATFPLWRFYHLICGFEKFEWDHFKEEFLLVLKIQSRFNFRFCTRQWNLAELWCSFALFFYFILFFWRRINLKFNETNHESSWAPAVSATFT